MRASHVGFDLVHSFCRWALLVAVVGFSLSANAFKGDKHADIEWSMSGSAARALPNSSGAGNNVFRPGAGGPTMGNSKALPWPGRNQAKAMAQWKMMASPREMAKTLTNPVGMLLGFGMTAALGAIIDAACTRLAGGSLTLREGAEWEECNFNTYTGPLYRINPNAVATWSSSKLGACRAYSAWAKDGHGWQSTTSTSGNITTHVEFEMQQDEQWCYAKRTTTVTGQPTSIAYTDYNGYQSMTGSVVERDEANPWKPATTQAAEDRITDALTTQSATDVAQSPDVDTALTARVLKDLAEAWKTELSSPYVTGPAEAVEETQTNVLESIKTLPDGTTETGTVTILTDTTHKFTYSDDTVTDNVEQKVTRTTTSGTTTTSETTTTQTKPDPEKVDDCASSTDLIKCGKFDTPRVDVPKVTKDLVFAEDNLGLGDGVCPSPISVSAGGHSYTISYQAACDFSTAVLRPVLLVIAAMMAYFIVAGGLKEA